MYYRGSRVSSVTSGRPVGPDPGSCHAACTRYTYSSPVVCVGECPGWVFVPECKLHSMHTRAYCVAILARYGRRGVLVPVAYTVRISLPNSEESSVFGICRDRRNPRFRQNLSQSESNTEAVRTHAKSCAVLVAMEWTATASAPFVPQQMHSDSRLISFRSTTWLKWTAEQRVTHL
jgi:hypothetical protein